MGSVGSKNLPTCLFHCTLWKSDPSPACRAVMMGLDAMNLSVTEVDIDLDKAEHRTPEITAAFGDTEMMGLDAMNVSDTEIDVDMDQTEYRTPEIIAIQASAAEDSPSIEIDLHFGPSHAINTYLASRYCDSEKLLPTNPAGRAIVDQLMHYDSGILYPHYRACAYPILYENCRFVMPQQIKEVEYAYQELETMLKGRTWFSGANMTLGDISIAATVSTLNVLVPVDRDKYPVLLSWMFRMSKEPFCLTGNLKGLNEFTKRIDTGNVLDSKDWNKCPRSSTMRRSTGAKLAET